MSIEIDAVGGGARVGRLVISVFELDRSIRFYGGLLGLSLRRRDPGFGYLSTADGIEVLLHERPTQPSPAAVAITFALPDVDAVMAGVREAGGVVLKAVERQPWGERMGVVQDPDGHIVCLSAAS